MTGQVKLAIDGRLATVTLSHPGKLNAMSRVMWHELRAVFETLQRHSALRCVMLRGEGGQFCAGGDISEYAHFRFEETT
ncbi:MAG: enoyl-CoA hydratase/isomerase family protein, partial [Burkholderiales bacterium]